MQAKLLSGRRPKIWLAAGSVTILTMGAWLAPRPAETPAPLVPLEERAAPLLDEQAQQRASRHPFADVREVATAVRSRVVAFAIPTPPPPPTRTDFFDAPAERSGVGFGAYVSGTHVLAHDVALAGRSAVQVSRADGSTRQAHVVAYDPATGLVLLQIDGTGQEEVQLAADDPAPGSLAVSVGHWGGRDLVAPVFVTSVEPDRLTIASGRGQPVPLMPIFNLDAQLLAIPVVEDSGSTAYRAFRRADQLMARASSGERLSSFGITFQQLTGLLTRTFGEGGVLVADVVPGAPGDLAGIRPGDVLLGAGEREVTSVDDATQALRSSSFDTAITLRIRRDGRIQEITATPALAYEVAALARADVPQAPATTVAASRVLAGEELLRAGVPASALIVGINGRPANSVAQVRRELRAQRDAVALLLQDGGARFFVALEPSR